MQPDLIDLMQRTVEALTVEIEKAERLEMERKLRALEASAAELQAQVDSSNVKMANALSLLRRLKARNGTESEDIRRHCHILSETLRKSA